MARQLRNGAFSYNAWVTILDDDGKPNNGPFEASRAIVTLSPTARKPAEHFGFFLHGHFMTFIQRSAVRVDSAEPRRSPYVPFRNPDDAPVLIMVSDDAAVSVRRVGGLTNWQTRRR